MNSLLPNLNSALLLTKLICVDFSLQNLNLFYFISPCQIIYHKNLSFFWVSKVIEVFIMISTTVSNLIIGTTMHHTSKQASHQTCSNLYFLLHSLLLLPIVKQQQMLFDFYTHKNGFISYFLLFSFYFYFYILIHFFPYIFSFIIAFHSFLHSFC